MRNNETSFDAGKEVCEPRDVCGIICQELTTDLRLLVRNSVRDAWWTSGVGKSFCTSTSIVHYYDPAGRSMVLGSTRPLSEIVPGIYPGG